jgi:hypothetical protein
MCFVASFSSCRDTFSGDGWFSGVLRDYCGYIRFFLCAWDF